MIDLLVDNYKVIRINQLFFSTLFCDSVFPFPEENFHPSLKPHFHSSYRPRQVKLIKANMRGGQTSDEQESENDFSC